MKESTRIFIPEEFLKMPNIYFFPDKTFFTEARARAKGIQISVKNQVPLDPRTLSELSVSKAPRGLFQYLFGLTRKKHAAKTYLKQKGLNMR